MPPEEEVDNNVDLNDVENADDSLPNEDELGNEVEEEEEEEADPKGKDDDEEEEEDDTSERDAKGRFKGKKDKEDKEDEEEEEADPKANKDKDGKDKDGKKIPYTRFKEVVSDRNKLQAQNDELMARLRAADPDVRRDERQGGKELAALDTQIKDVDVQLKAKLADIDTQVEGLYEQVEELRLESKTKEAAAAQRKIDAYKEKRAELRQEAVEAKAAFARQKDSITNRVESRREAAVAAENAEYDRRIDHLTSVVPQFDPEDDEYDHKAVKEFQFDVAAYEKAGMTPTQALTRAATLFLGHDPFDKKAAAKAARATEGKGNEKRGTRVRENVEKDRKQPPRTRGRAEEADTKLDGANMTEEQWSKLSEAEQRKYLGDVVE